LTKDEQIVATHFTHDVPYPAIAAELSKPGEPVSDATARQRGTRFAQRVRAQFGGWL
jgi:hypothetical protein